MSNESNRPAGDVPEPDEKPQPDAPQPDGAQPEAADKPTKPTTPTEAAGATEATPAVEQPAQPPQPAGPLSGSTAAPGEPQAKRSGPSSRQILIAVLAVLMAGVVAYGVRQLTSGPANAEVGDCVSVTAETDNRAEVDTHDCSADKASFKVGKVLDATDATCPEEGLYTEIAPAGSVGDGYKLCLLPNMAEGACYKPDEGTGFVKTECTGPETIKVTKVVQGSTDLEACPDGAGMSYPEPPVTYCLAPAEM
ncbi:LppU/SCO3897 family protein [Saccharothrix deserti]|uniref:LppU/SCO3897 family protein n=1 Tax=Saccharothrix deserti TaxID=2593674 RepID=UPI00131A6651|nr:hypothetical protein [Saccharothrix deserti]